MKLPLLSLYSLFSFSTLLAQTPITNVIYDYTATDKGVSYTKGASNYKFGKNSGTTRNNQNVTGIIFPGQTFYYNFYVNGFMKIRRVNNSAVTGNRSLIWMEGKETGNNILISPPYEDTMEQVLYGRTINRGTDNLFGNQGDGSGNNNNIERVDWIVPSGMKSSSISQSGFAIFERGADNGHDPFCIAAILAVDADNTPTLYGPVLRVASANYGNLPSSSFDYAILRKEETETLLSRTGTGTQNRGGVFVSLEKLGVDINQTVFGYSLFAADLPANATPDNLINYTDKKYFPTTTSSNTGEGGIDFIAITGLFNTTYTSITLPVSIAQWEAKKMENQIQLTWQLKNSAFCDSVVIEKSVDGLQWQKLAQLPSDQTAYADSASFSNRQFYRLKIYEKSGSIQYSTVKQIEATAGLKVQSFFEVKQLNDQLQLAFDCEASQSAIITLVNMHGQQLLQKRVQTVKGINQLVLPAGESKGVVIVSVQADNGLLQKKVVIR